jgi:hypothetical protein
VTELNAAPKSESRATVTMRIPRTAKKDYRYVITLDTERDGRALGEVTEILVNIAPMKAH